MTLSISETSVCNVALVELGQDPVSSLSQDTKNARLCNAVFGICRNEVLEGHAWSFATKTVELASIDGSDDVMGEWTYLYQKPADLLKILRGEDWKQEFEIRDAYLMANDEPLKIKYIFECTNTGLWSASFAQCLSKRIKASIAYAVTRSTTVAEKASADYVMSLKEARYNDAHKRSPENPVLDSFIDQRF
jgi:hypothetical protein